MDPAGPEAAAAGARTILRSAVGLQLWLLRCAAPVSARPFPSGSQAEGQRT